MSGGRWLLKRSLSLSGHRTSVALEAEFWHALEQLAEAEGCTLSGLVARIDLERDQQRPLASALRVRCLTVRETARETETPRRPEPA